MKFIHIALGCALAVTAITPAFAQKGSENGKPFQALQSQIDANQAAIAANADAIAGITVDIEEINLRIDNLEADVEQIEIDVANNAADIAAALARISSTEANVAALQSDLAALAAAHAADSAAIHAQLAALEAELLNLNALREALAADLQAQLDALQAQVNGNTFAIDGALLQLVTINAQLTVINSDILAINAALDSLSAAQADNDADLADLEARVSALESAVTVLQSYHLYTFSGIQTNLPESDLNGWEQCYSATYAEEAHAEDMLAACTGSKIMLACRPTGSSVLTLAAYANRSDVFYDTGMANNVVHNANGVDWYFSANYSMGFAPQGEGVTRSSADTQDQSSPYRLSWHTHDYYANGWRCGSNVWLNGNGAWEKVIYQAD